MKVKQVWFVGTTGEVLRLKELEGKEVSLEAMHPHIGNGCSIVEHVGLKKGVDMWVDEEGLLKTNWVGNALATQMYRDAFPQIDPKELGIAGNAIITDNTAKGNYMTKYV